MSSRRDRYKKQEKQHKSMSSVASHICAHRPNPLDRCHATSVDHTAITTFVNNIIKCASACISQQTLISKVQIVRLVICRIKCSPNYSIECYRQILRQKTAGVIRNRWVLTLRNIKSRGLLKCCTLYCSIEYPPECLGSINQYCN